MIHAFDIILLYFHRFWSLIFDFNYVKPCHAAGLFLFPQKTISDVFKGSRKRPLTWNGLKITPMDSSLTIFTHTCGGLFLKNLFFDLDARISFDARTQRLLETLPYNIQILNLCQLEFLSQFL